MLLVFFSKIVLYTIGKSNQDGRNMITILLISNCSKGSSNHTPLAYWICYQCFIISKTGSLSYGLKEKNIKNFSIVITCKQLRYMQKNKMIIWICIVLWGLFVSIIKITYKITACFRWKCLCVSTVSKIYINMIISYFDPRILHQIAMY